MQTIGTWLRKRLRALYNEDHAYYIEDCGNIYRRGSLCSRVTIIEGSVRHFFNALCRDCSVSQVNSNALTFRRIMNSGSAHSLNLEVNRLRVVMHPLNIKLVG